MKPSMVMKRKFMTFLATTKLECSRKYVNNVLDYGTDHPLLSHISMTLHAQQLAWREGEDHTHMLAPDSCSGSVMGNTMDSGVSGAKK
jgi:hypothetical protein